MVWESKQRAEFWVAADRDELPFLNSFSVAMAVFGTPRAWSWSLGGTDSGQAGRIEVLADQLSPHRPEWEHTELD